MEVLIALFEFQCCFIVECHASRIIKVIVYCILTLDARLNRLAPNEKQKLERNDSCPF